MRLSLAEAAVRGTSPLISAEARKCLDRGDIAGLLQFHKQRFGGWMMEGDDDDADDDEDEDDSDDTGEGDDEDDEDEDDGGDDDSQVKRLTAEAKKRRIRARRQRERIAELEATVARLEKGKGKPKGKDDEDESDEDNSAEVQTLKGQNETLVRQNEDLLIRIEFTNLVTGPNAKVKFRNPKTALRVLDLDDVEITEDGDVEGLEEAIEALAKSDPYLLETGKKDDDEEDGKKPRRRAGQPTGNRRKKGNPNRDRLVAKYPALRR